MPLSKTVLIIGCDFFTNSPLEGAIHEHKVSYRHWPTIRHSLLKAILDQYFLARLATPALILLNIHPDVDNSRQLLACLKNHPFSQATPILVYGPSLPPSVISELYNQGASLYMEEPSDWLQVIGLLRTGILQDQHQLLSHPISLN